MLFDVTSMPDYGAFSGRNRDDMIAGARVEVAPYKKDPADFVLWKPAGDHPGWDSPWGKGRPGWHIECSAMSETHLGETFDIHGGGVDLIFPHHENEIAQSKCAHHGKPMANYWLHNGFLTVQDEKMSKSLGNITKVHEVLKNWPAEAARYLMLSAHYRAPLNWSEDGLEQAKRSLDRLYLAMQRLADVEPAKDVGESHVIRAIEDDLNTPEAFAALHDLARDANKAESEIEKAELKAMMLAGGKILGVLRQAPEAWLKGADGGDGLPESKIEDLIAARNAARKQRDFAEVRPHPRRAQSQWRDPGGRPRRNHMEARRMSKRERLYLYDTTLRDGAQTQGVDFSVEDKRLLATALDKIGVAYVEGGWPGANPTDTAFFAKAPTLGHRNLHRLRHDPPAGP